MPNERGYINELQVVDDDERKFAGWATVEVVDRQGEVLNIDDVTKIMDVIMKRGGAIIDSHTNRVVGKLLNWQKTLHPMTQKDAIRVTGMIFKDYVIDNVVWDKIKEKIYKGLSFGGSSLKKIPSIEGGRPIETLRQLEGYEISVCENPANPHALIDDINMLAKSNVDETDKLARERVYLEPGQEAPKGQRSKKGVGEEGIMTHQGNQAGQQKAHTEEKYQLIRKNCHREAQAEGQEMQVQERLECNELMKKGQKDTLKRR